MKKNSIQRQVTVFFLLLLMTGIFFCSKPASVQAATPGFRVINGKTYYIEATGRKHTGWLTLNSKKYYFYPSTGVMATGWYKNSKGQYRYFNPKTGVMTTGWLKNSEGKFRFFHKSTGIMYTGWIKDSKGQYRYFGSNGFMYTGWYKNKDGKYRYFSKGTGIMLTGYHNSGTNIRRFNASGIMYTGWVKEAAGLRYYNKSTGVMVTGFTETNGKTRYFNPVKPSSGLGTYGVLLTGLRTIGGKKYYFNPATTLDQVASGKTGGYMAVSSFKTVSSKTYYFQKNGQAKTGWLSLNSKRYYFGTDCVMYANKKASIGGITYRFDSNGVATTDYAYSPNGMLSVSGSGRTLYIYPAYTNIPGVANGSIDDITLLAAVADREMGGAGVNGMMGVVMCILNRTLPANTAFPNTVRYCIYQYPQQFSESANGSFAVLEKKLRNPGTSAWANEAGARTAAQNALAIFNSYKTKGTPRTIPGYTTTDFDYIGFMTPAAMRDAIANGGANPNRMETFGGICTYYDCWNRAWGNS